MTDGARAVRRASARPSCRRAATLFLSNGYQGTSVDQIAASAEVSKQTVYKHFGDKQELLLAIVNDALDSTVTPFLDRIAALADTTDLEADLTALAGDYLRAVLQEPVVQLRRLVVGEANRVPALAQLYYEQAPARTLAAFADCFGTAARSRPACTCPEPSLAAEHFAFLIVGRCIDQALFCGGPQVLAGIDVDRTSARACRCFSPAIGRSLRRMAIGSRRGRRGRPARRCASARRIRVADDDGSAVVDEHPRRGAADVDLPDPRQRGHRRREQRNRLAASR